MGQEDFQYKVFCYDFISAELAIENLDVKCIKS